jgi:hypothetical protein
LRALPGLINPGAQQRIDKSAESSSRYNGKNLIGIIAKDDEGEV